MSIKNFIFLIFINMGINNSRNDYYDQLKAERLAKKEQDQLYYDQLEAERLAEKEQDQLYYDQLEAERLAKVWELSYLIKNGWDIDNMNNLFLIKNVWDIDNMNNLLSKLPMPELLKKVTRQEADSQLKNTQENLRQSSYNVLVDNVNAAKKAGVDVSDIEAQMPELLKKIQR